MADAVTKKDLQSLQGTFNKQIKDIEKRIEKAEGNISILQDLPTKQDDVLSKLMMDITDKLQKDIYALQDAVKKLRKS
jgi:hypothetical protein